MKIEDITESMDEVIKGPTHLLPLKKALNTVRELDAGVDEVDYTDVVTALENLNPNTVIPYSKLEKGLRVRYLKMGWI